MKPKYSATWNESHSVINLNIKHNECIQIQTKKQNNCQVQHDELIANVEYNEGSRQIIAPITGHLNWISQEQIFNIESSEQYVLFGYISTNKQVKECESTSSSIKSDVIKLSYEQLGNQFIDKFYLHKWKINVGDIVTPGIIGYYSLNEYDDNYQELKTVNKGVVTFLAKTKESYNNQEILAKLLQQEQTCRHIKIEDNRCLFCNEYIVVKKQQESCFPDWQLDEQTAARYSKDLIRNILVNKKKLVMVLDLDQTILHAIKIVNSFDTYKYCANNPGESFLEMKIDPKVKFLIKLRPYFESFLIQLIPKYEIYVYTKASKSYADFILAHINHILFQKIPQHQPYFARVFSREDTNCQNSKSLHRLFHPGIADNLMVILDDNPYMWANFKQNLIHTKPFNYFKENNKTKDAQGILIDVETEITIENGHDFWLHSITKTLEQISDEFWNQIGTQSSSSQLLDYIINNKIGACQIYQQIRNKILKGISLFFAISQAHPDLEKKGLEQAKIQAYYLGAKIYNEFKENLFLNGKDYYLITWGRRKIKSIQFASEHNIPIIHYKWIEDCDSYLRLLDYKNYIESDNWQFSEYKLKEEYLNTSNTV